MGAVHSLHDSAPVDFGK